ncbi:MAG TPA: hypothetical protein DCF33_15540 [Saprospirales bacterium]|nr:hypothetical protein [Saprospirales bacterium]
MVKKFIIQKKHPGKFKNVLIYSGVFSFRQLIFATDTKPAIEKPQPILHNGFSRYFTGYFG